MFLEERNIKVKKNYIFSHIFNKDIFFFFFFGDSNKGRLKKSKRTNLRWVKY